MPAQPLGLYSADTVYITWGAITIQGRGPETFCKVERTKESFTLKKGADGEGSRSRILDHSGKVTITVMQTAAVNALLQAALLADEASPNGVSIFPMMVKDYGGNALWTATHAWLERPAMTEAAAEAGTREWTLICNDLEAPLPAHA